MMRAIGKDLFVLDPKNARVLSDQNRVDCHPAQCPRVGFFKNAPFFVGERIIAQNAVRIGFKLFFQRPVAVELPDEFLHVVSAHPSIFRLELRRFRIHPKESGARAPGMHCFV